MPAPTVRRWITSSQASTTIKVFLETPTSFGRINVTSFQPSDLQPPGPQDQTGKATYAVTPNEGLNFSATIWCEHAAEATDVYVELSQNDQVLRCVNETGTTVNRAGVGGHGYKAVKVGSVAQGDLFTAFFSLLVLSADLVEEQV